MKPIMSWPLFVSLPLIGIGLATASPIDSRAGWPLFAIGVVWTAIVVIDLVMFRRHSKDMDRIQVETDRRRSETAEMVRQINKARTAPPGPLIVSSMTQSDFDELKRRADRTNSKIEDVVCDLLRKGAKDEPGASNAN